MSYRRCLETATEAWEECTQERDEGHNACDDWDDRCCTWWPCSWGCKLITWVCVGWQWIANIVCVAWKLVEVVVCVVWETVNVFVFFLGLIGGLILAIPFLGRILSEILNIITDLIWRVVNLVVDLVLGIFGLDLTKYMRIGIIILRDGKVAVGSEAALEQVFQQAKIIFKNAANIELELMGTHTEESSAPSNALSITCDISSWGTDLGTAGSYYEFKSLRFWDSRVSRVIGLSSPITVFAISNIDPTSTDGCSLGPLTDYVLVEGGNPVCFAHELGHSCGLILPTHDGDPQNLNNAICGGEKLKGWQRILVRSSRHASYF